MFIDKLVLGFNGFVSESFRKYSRLDQKRFRYVSTSTTQDGVIRCKSLFKDLYNCIPEEVDHLILMGAVIPNDFNESNYELMNRNIEIFNNVYEFIIRKEIKNFTYLSGFGSVTNPLLNNCTDFYTASKLIGENFCNILRGKGVSVNILRPSAPYGHLNRKRTVINLFVDKAISNEDISVYGTGRREQNFIYIKDLVASLDFAIQGNPNENINVYSSHNINMHDLAKLIVRITNSSSRILTGEVSDLQEDFSPKLNLNELIKDELKFDCKFDIESGLRDFVSEVLN